MAGLGGILGGFVTNFGDVTPEQMSASTQLMARVIEVELGLVHGRVKVTAFDPLMPHKTGIEVTCDPPLEPAQERRVTQLMKDMCRSAGAAPPIEFGDA